MNGDELMQISGMNPRQASQAVGVSKKTVCRWLNGEGKAPHQRHAFRIDELIREYEELIRSDYDEYLCRLQGTIAEQ